MSFLAPKTESPVLSPATPARNSTYQEAQPVPFAVGFFRVACKWITDRFNDHWSNGSQTGQAYCSIVGVITHGPIDHVRVIIKSSDAEWQFSVDRPTNPADPNYYFYPFSYGGPDKALGPTCIGRIYWGREDQPVDTWLNSKTGQNHPPYRGLAYVVFERLHCGQITAGTQAKPAVPNVEFTGYRMPSENLPPGLRIPSSLSGAMYRGVNAVSALADILMNQRAGLGLDGRVIDLDDWVAKAQALETGTKRAGGVYGPDVYISPLLAGDTEAEQIVTDVLSYFDGWLFSKNNKLQVDWYPNDGSIPSTLTEISEHEMVEPPNIKTGSLTEAPTTIVVSCLDSGPGVDVDVIEATETAAVPFVRELRGDVSVKKIERPWITNREIAAGYAARYARTSTVPEMEGDCLVLLDKAIRPNGEPLVPGDMVRINWAPSDLLVVARITETAEEDTAVRIKWQRERGMTSLPYVPATDPREIYVAADPVTPGSTDWAVIDTPDLFGSTPSAVAFVRRPSTELLGVKVYMDVDGDWSAGATHVATQTFTAAGNLQVSVATGDTFIDVASLDDDFSPALGSGIGAADQANNTLIAVVEDEWCSIGSVTVLSPGVYRIGVLRGRLGSVPAAHASGSRVWVQALAQLTILSHAALEALQTRYFKVLSYNATADSAMSAAKSLTFRLRNLGAADLLNGYLTNTAHALPASSAGVVSSYAGATGRFLVELNGVDVTNSCVFSVLDAAGTTSSIGADGTYSTTAVSGAVSVVKFRATYRGRSLDRTFSLTKAVAGVAGVTPTIYWVEPSSSTIMRSVLGVYTPASITLAFKSKSSGNPSAYSGRCIIADSSNGTTYTDRYTSSSNESSKSYTPNAGIKLLRCRLYLAGGTTTLLAEIIIGVVNDGATGTRGNVRLYYSIGAASVWSDASANAALAAQGLSAQTNDEVTLFNDAGTFASTKRWNGSAWVVLGQVLDGSLLVNGSVTAQHLAAVSAWAKQFTIGAGGYFSSGQTAFNTGTGWWMDYNGGTPRMSLGVPGSKGFAWDGSTFNLFGDNITLGGTTIRATATSRSQGTEMVQGTLGTKPLSSIGTYAGGSGAFSYSGGDLTLFGRRKVVTINPVFSMAKLDTGTDATPTLQLGWGTSAVDADPVINQTFTITKSNGITQINEPTLIQVLAPTTQIVGLRVQPSTASSNVARTLASHKLTGAFVSPGTSNAYTFTVDITNKGFTTAPNWGIAQALAEESYSVVYRDDLSSATTAHFRVTKRSGAAFALNETVWYKALIELID